VLSVARRVRIRRHRSARLRVPRLRRTDRGGSTLLAELVDPVKTRNVVNLVNYN
jgi:hypothetical protein